MSMSDVTTWHYNVISRTYVCTSTGTYIIHATYYLLSMYRNTIGDRSSRVLQMKKYIRGISVERIRPGCPIDLGSLGFHKKNSSSTRPILLDILLFFPLLHKNKHHQHDVSTHPPSNHPLRPPLPLHRPRRHKCRGHRLSRSEGKRRGRCHFAQWIDVQGNSSRKRCALAGFCHIALLIRAPLFTVWILIRYYWNSIRCEEPSLMNSVLISRYSYFILNYNLRSRLKYSMWHQPAAKRHQPTRQSIATTPVLSLMASFSTLAGSVGRPCNYHPAVYSKDLAMHCSWWQKEPGGNYTFLVSWDLEIAVRETYLAEVSCYLHWNCWRWIHYLFFRRILMFYCCFFCLFFITALSFSQIFWLDWIFFHFLIILANIIGQRRWL